MNRLPTEILNQIFLLFDQKQKTEFMRVCRSWERTIKTYCLFHTVRILTMSGLKKLIEKVQSEPDQGARVERLVLDFVISNDFDMNLIRHLFPNIHVFYVFGCKEIQKMETMSIYPWYRHIQFIMENKNTQLSGHLLTSGMCSHLKILLVNGGFSNSRQMISLLPQAPTLERIKMTECNFTIDDLELLHTSLPRLHTILFYNGQLLNSFLPANIKPATTMKVLQMHFLDVFEIETQSRFLQYISKKYTNLLELSIHAVCYDLDENKIDSVYEDGWIPLFRTLGSNLTTLSIDPNRIPDNIFEILDNSGCRIQNLHLGSYTLPSTIISFKNSRQMEFISSLIIEDSGGDSTRFEYLKELLSLKKLKLVSSRTFKEPINLTNVLEACPDTLKSLSVQDGELILDNLTRSLFSVQYLSLCRVVIPKALDAFISQYLPTLNTLILDDCNLYRRLFNLSACNLWYFEILDYFPPYSNSILVHTLKNMESRWFHSRHQMTAFDEHKELFDIHDSQIYPVIKSLPFDEFASIPFTTLICNSLKDLVVISKE